MKNLSYLVAAIVLASAPVFAQEKEYHDIDVKKDVILRDKNPYAKFAGKVGMSKTDCAVLSLNGDTLISIKGWDYNTENPQFSLMHGYKIVFKPSGKSMIKLLPNVSLVSKNHVVDFVLQNRSFSSFKRDNEFRKDLIAGNALDEAVVDEYISLYNGETEIKNADEYQAREKEMILKYYPVKRDLNMPVSYKYEGGVTNVYQDGTLLISIKKEQKANSMSEEWVYTFYKELTEPFHAGDKKIYNITVATATMNSFPKLYVNAKGKAQSVKAPSLGSAERALVEILVANKDL
ncbi:hypothetical protein [Dawidia soli]|uniref:Uncharacterized protein n=1 Tax=Dawidia soli TaxID=2782352 RepID=A0AAP2DB12_9BACT|nr:hypothetical protein [Dawidia soli]MBT1688696.1 hypothetical protein [Dawidia soli]